jgi:hypothetical protein
MRPSAGLRVDHMKKERMNIMAKPPESPPHSDIDGVNRDARTGSPSKSPHPDPGKALDNADAQSKGRPEETPPQR